jgi:hypothetical protein
MSTAANDNPRLQSIDGRDDDRPVVRIVAGKMAENTTRVQQLLMEAGAQLYVRGAVIVRAIEEKQKASEGQDTSTVALQQVDKVYLRDQMNKMIHFERFDIRTNAMKTCNAPMEIAETLLSRKGEWGFQTVAGVINAPTLRPDGSVLSAPGYDNSTGLILQSRLKMPHMPDRPTRADALHALELLKDILAEFPFVPDADKGETGDRNASLSVALSMLITPTVRGCMDVAPMHVGKAPDAGTGKSYLANIAAAIALGERCSVMSVNGNDEETEKRLGARAMAGNPIISLDNVNGELGGDMLCQLISEATVEARILGQSQMVRVPNRFCIFANGNNLRLKGDITRRAITCSLNARTERPSEREFDRKPFEEVMADRGRYVAACLTIVRAYFVAGRPAQTINGEPLMPMNSFEQWSNTVRSALVWLGCADPVSTVAKAQANDPERQAVGMFVAAFREEIGAGVLSAQTAAQILARCDDSSFSCKCPSLRAAVNNVSSNGKPPTPKGLGKWLMKNVDRQVDGYAIKAIGMRSGCFSYYVEVAE